MLNDFTDYAFPVENPHFLKLFSSYYYPEINPANSNFIQPNLCFFMEFLKQHLQYIGKDYL